MRAYLPCVVVALSGLALTSANVFNGAADFPDFLTAISLVNNEEDPRVSFFRGFESATLLEGEERDEPYLTRVETEDDWTSVAAETATLLKFGRASKFLIDARHTPRVYFMNGTYVVDGVTPDYVKYHYFFARDVLKVDMSIEEFNANTYFTQDKKFYAGTLQAYFLTKAQGSTEVVYGVQFYPQDEVNESTLLRAMLTVNDAFTVPESKLSFVATNVKQTTSTIVDELDRLGIGVMKMEDLLDQVEYIPMFHGEAWGYLRIFPNETQTAQLSAYDIAVFEELPLSLAVVSGAMTKAYQDPNSHINLKSRERRTPNAVYRSASRDDHRLAPFKDKPVHFVVGASDFFLEETTPEIVEAKVREKFDRPWIDMHWDPEYRLLSYRDMCVADPAGCINLNTRYGSKASNLGFLGQSQVLGTKRDVGSLSNEVGYDLTPTGFAIPFSFYDNFVNHEDNADLRAAMKELVELEKVGTPNVSERTKLVDKIQKTFYNSKFPESDLKDVLDMIKHELPGIQKVKFRSSANAEDIRGFDGAGLYDSFTAKLKDKDRPDMSCERYWEDDHGEVKPKMKPATVQCVLKGAYASLWNVRAVAERSVARLSHSSAVMGVAVLPKYDTESPVAANSVVVTRAVDWNLSGYSLSIQQGNNVVTNPEPGTIAESTVAVMGEPDEDIGFTTFRYAKPTPESPVMNTTILTRQEMQFMVDIVAKVEIEYCKAKEGYLTECPCKFAPWCPAKTKGLDLEFKVLENGKFLCKQVREFQGDTGTQVRLI